MKLSRTFLILGIFLFITFIYFITSPGPTPYNLYVLLANSLLQGRLDVDFHSWLEVFNFNGKYYFGSPPMPAFLLIPFVFVFGQNFSQQILAHFVGAAIGVAFFILTFKLTQNIKSAFYIAILSSFGSIIWFLSSVGSSWFLAQITAVLFLALALVESFGAKRPFVIGVLIGAAFLSRFQTILSLPLFLFFLKNKISLKTIVQLTLGLGIFIGVDGLYNLLRFGSPFETGYGLMHWVKNEPWFAKGQFHYSYIPRHLSIIFLSFPKFTSDFPYLIPSLSGLAIWITTPSFIYSLFAGIRERYLLVCWFSIFLIALINFSFGSTAYASFGYRYATDFYPLLILLTLKGLGNNLKWHHWLLLAIGVFVNLWGVLWMGKFGWVT